MLTIDRRPVPPSLPAFSRDLQNVLVTAAGATPTPRPRLASRRARYALAGVAAAAAVAIAVLGIETGGGPLGPGSTRSGGPAAHPRGEVHLHLAAFSVDTTPDGTVTITLTQGQVFDPATMEHALARAGVAAVVTIGSVCTVPGTNSDGLNAVISRFPGRNGHSVTVITPAAIPAGEELSFGYFAVPDGGGLHVSLIPEHTKLTCSATPPVPSNPGSGPG